MNSLPLFLFKTTSRELFDPAENLPTASAFLTV
jgi:hypothetical protein